MPRQIITITPSQKRWLQAAAKKAGISITEAIRRLIDEKRGQQ
jgi:hypothetical protein